jgi:hypothetical protein
VSGLVEAASFSSAVEAELARLRLENEGVEAVLFDTGISQSYGGLFMPVRLMVLEEDLAAARQVLGEQF